jgi:Predicted metal-binding, possibly nucleic acid-binding protein
MATRSGWRCGQTHWCTESAPAASTPSNGKRRCKQSGRSGSAIWMTRISTCPSTKKDIWM